MTALAAPSPLSPGPPGPPSGPAAAIVAVPPALAQPTGLAFFDFDHTLIDGDAGPLFGRHLFRTRRRELREGPRRRRRALLLWGRYAPFILWMGVQAALYGAGARKRSSIVRSAYRGLRGIPVASFEAEVDAFVVRTVVGRLFPLMLQVVREHLDAGRRCILLTTGMEPLVRRVLPFLPPGVELIGCRLLHRRGTLTGKVEGPLFGVDKANMLTAYARAVRVPLKECWAYSDHWSDLAMLEAVGHPVVVNPRGRLRKRAQGRGWAILAPSLPKAK
jgi:HAD superfamily hydrolase (TIGR01490 family)